MGPIPEAGDGGPRAIGNKINVEVGSLETLATQIGDDVEAFHGQVEVWQQASRVDHPTNAQFSGGTKGLGSTFMEAGYLDGRNDGSYAVMRGMVQLIQLGMGALHSGANNLSEVYPGVDGFNNVQLGAVQNMFPEVPLQNPGDIGKGDAAPGAGWVKASDGKGWDTNGDGTADILFGPSGGPPPNLGGQSHNDPPKPVNADTRDDYDPATNTTTDRPDQNGLDSATYWDYQEEVAEEPIIVAPGADWNREPGQGTADTPPGTVTV
jgi:hypothetical protein